ncbi:hypothetical protein A3E65_02125 [Candidatus Kaiserbacteria bacterium RIFCSPHIGHO2_12_FULL_56_13]|uniref:Bacterial sugar transferase domain-containing protein n=1 Tax=Candidatus Kaiserbacteria bacterium RIFCSPHIGHO2_12_FULL_56_13 TaxID=1798505 RepID=A0A1F6EF25_9BACT|nr:MAG: hypothetical protein A3E65_02125 [Candidatus Kaiserbacteria bacterium RIFCSPHIGHO2_12_FULL_56_13]
MAFSRRETAILLIGDFLLLFLSLLAALLLRNLEIPELRYWLINILPFIPIFVISLVVFYTAGLYEKQTRPIRRVMSMRIFGAQLANIVIAALIFFALPLTIAPKTILVLYLVISVVAVSLWRFYRMNRERTTTARASALLIGAGRAVAELLEEVTENDLYRIRFTSYLDTARAGDHEVADAVYKAVAGGVRTIVLDTRDPRVTRDLPRLYPLMTKGTTFIDFVSFYEDIFNRVPLDHVGIERLLESLPRRRSLYDLVKRGTDLALALAGFLLAIPLIVLAALVLSLTDGSAFIRHERIGRGGGHFRVYKLRTMLFDDHGDPELQKKNRVTLFGRLLRKTRIDELPQLWNVLKGELSFIGPRPELPKIAEVYEREIPFYHLRHLIAPGLSGWAQIHDYNVPRGAADIEKTRRKLSFDLYYLKRRSFGLDLAITLKTLRALLSLSGT